MPSVPERLPDPAGQLYLDERTMVLMVLGVPRHASMGLGTAWPASMGLGTGWW